MRSVDHHLFEYGEGLDGLRWVLITSQMALFSAKSLRLKVLVSLMGVGGGNLSRLSFSMGRKSGHGILRKFSLGI